MAETLETNTPEDAAEAGFFGTVLDPTPNHAYTLEGVGAGEPTPETDEGAKAAAKARKEEVEAKLSGREQQKAASKSSSKSSSS